MANTTLINKSLNTRADGLTLDKALETVRTTKSEDFKFLLVHKLRIVRANLQDKRKHLFASMAKNKSVKKNAEGFYPETNETYELLSYIQQIDEYAK